MDMNCNKCSVRKHHNQMYYDADTLKVYCDDCLQGEGIPYNDIENHLKEYRPELFKIRNNSISTRLNLSQIVYLFKFAQEKSLPNMSQTIAGIIDELEKHVSLDDVALIDSPFKRTRKVPEKEVPFLKRRVTEKQTIQIGKPNPTKKDDDSEGMITI